MGGALGLALLPAARRALDELAAPMGLEARPELLRFERTGFHRANAAGRVEGGRVILHPERFDARLPAGRALLAHELAHLFQQRLPAINRDTSVAAEAEARAIAARVREGRSFARPAIPLAAKRVLFDQSPTLNRLVGDRYSGEIQRIQRLLRGWLGFLWVTDGDVREIFSMVEELDFASTQAVFAALTEDERATLMDNVSPGHFGRFRRSILAAFSETGRSTLARQNEDLFAGMSFSGLDRDELLAVHHILTSGFPSSALDRLREREGQGRYVRRIVDAEGGIAALAGLDGESFEVYRNRRSRRAIERLEGENRRRAAAVTAATQDNAQTIGILRDLLEDPNDDDRLEALDRLSSFLDRRQQFEGIVFSLQAPSEMDGALDRLLDDFPRRELLAASGEGAAGSRGPRHRRIETLLRVAELRPAWKNTRLAESLLSSNFFNLLTSSEAFMAFQLLRALPPQVRAGFLEEDEERAARLYSAMSQSMREQQDLNFYRGGEGRLDLASIQSQLLDDALWDIAEIGRLSGLMRMAGAAGEAEWLFSRSREVAAAQPSRYENPDFQARVVEPFMLYGSRDAEGQPRLAWEPSYGDWAVENIWQAIGASFESIGDVFQLLGDSRSGGQLVGNALFGQSIGGEGISAAAFQDLLGGSFMGIRFVAPEDRIENAELAREIREADEADRGVNYIDRAYWDTGRGALELSARDLAIAAIRYPIGDLLVSAGRGRIRGLELSLAYAPERSAGAATNLSIGIAELSLDDLLLVFHDSMVAINRLSITDFSVALGRDAIGGERAQARTGVDPITLNPITPILRLIGLSGHIEDSTGEMVAALTRPAEASPLRVSVNQLTLHGLQTSSGQYFETVALYNTEIGVAGNLDDYLLILADSIRANERQRARLIAVMAALPTVVDRTTMERRSAQLAARISALESLDSELRAAQETVADLEPRRDALGESEAQRLRLASDILAPYREGGITFDAGRIRVAGAEGRLSLANLNLSDVHGHGGGAPGLLAFLTDSEAMNRIAQGPAHDPPLRRGGERGRAEFTLELGDIAIDELSLGAGIPSLEDAEADLERARAAHRERSWDPQLAAAFERAKARRDAVEEYRALAAVGAAYLSPAEVEQMQRLHTQLLAEEALYVHHLEARGTRVGFDAGRGAVSLGADYFHASGREGASGRDAAAIRAGDVSIGSASGSNIDLLVGVGGGLHGFENLRERLSRLGIRGDSLTLDEVNHASSATSVQRVEAETFDFDLQVRDWTLDARAARIHAGAFSQRITRRGLDTEIQGLENRGAMRTESEDALLAALRETRATLDGFEALFTELGAAIDDARSADDEGRLRMLEGQRRDAYGIFRDWERRVGARMLTIVSLDARISADENLAATRFDLSQSLEGGIAIQGRGRSENTGRTDRIFASATLDDARYDNIQAGHIAVGEAAGRLSYGRRRISFDNLAIVSLAVSQFHMTSRGSVEVDEGGGTAITQIFSDGTSTLSGIRISGSLDFDPVEGGDREYRLAQVHIPELAIRQLSADGLGYFRHHRPPRDGERHPEVNYGRSEYRVESGVLRGLQIRDLDAELPANEDAHPRLSADLAAEGLDQLQISAFIDNTLNDSSVRLSSSAIHLHMESEEGVTRLSGIDLPSLTLHRCHFRAPGGRALRASQPVHFHGISADAAIDSTDSRNSVITLNSLHVARVTGSELSAEWPPYTVSIRQDERLESEARLYGREPEAPLTIANLDITGLRWSSRDGVGPAGARGAANIDVERVHAALNAMNEDETMNLDSVIDAGNIDFDFLRDGTQRVEIDDIDASFRGQAAEGITVDTQLNDIATGEIRIDGRRISVPNLSIPTLNLEHLDYDSDTMRLRIPEYNGRATLTGTTAALEITTAPEDSQAPFERLAITELLVPNITLRGVTVTLKDLIPNEEGSDELEITIDPLHGASITNLRVTPRPGEPAFTIVPDPSGRDPSDINGRVHLESFNAIEIGAEVENLLSAEAKLDATALDFDFLGSGATSFSLQQLRLRELSGNYGDHHFNVSSGRSGSSTQSTAPEITLNGLAQAADGSVTLDSAALSGLVYKRHDLGVSVDVMAAELPARGRGPALTYGSDGTLEIPEAVIRSAKFHVDDLSAMGGGSGEPSMLEHMDFLDALSGSVTATIGIPYAPDDTISFEVSNGEISLEAIEDTLWSDLGVDFDFDEESDRLVLNIDYGNAIGLIPAMIPQLNYEAVAFDLSGDTTDDEERRNDARRDRARLSTLATRIEDGDSSGDPPISIYDIHAALNLDSTRVDLRGIGGLLVSGDGDASTSDLTVSGALRPLGQGPSALNLSVDTLNAAVDPADPLIFAREDGSSLTVDSAELEISDIVDTRIDFKGLTTPGELNGRIREARIRNVRVTRSSREEDEP
ncbi:MAG: DUF4157 domain-containing protein [Halieaceae bacterium]|jgi:hypothetical protein|nr:DUF4157 domain-containing protein [Halieaceae bacterium]